MTLNPDIQVGTKHISFLPFSQHSLDGEYHLPCPSPSWDSSSPLGHAEALRSSVVPSHWGGFSSHELFPCTHGPLCSGGSAAISFWGQKNFWQWREPQGLAYSLPRNTTEIYLWGFAICLGLFRKQSTSPHCSEDPPLCPSPFLWLPFSFLVTPPQPA